MSSNIKIKKNCKFCRQEFVAKTTVTEYCSNKCSSLAYKSRKREEKIKISDNHFFIEKGLKLANPSKEFLSVTETSLILGISRWTISRLITKKVIKSKKLGNRVIISKQSITELFN